MSVVFYDTHAHLDYPEFAFDFPQVLERAREAGIARIITIGTDLASSEQAVRLAEQHTQIFAVVGWHPCSAMEAPEDVRPALRKLASHPRVVAIGETGLDYFRLPSGEGGTVEADEAYKAKQLLIFEQQLEVANDLGLNCVIHQRESQEEVIGILEKYQGQVRGVFHCFVGTSSAQQRIKQMGSMVSFTGIVTFKNAQEVRATLSQTALGDFMLETDAPFLAPTPNRGKRCEPAHVRRIAEIVAEVKGCTLEELSEATCVAAHRFFPKLSKYPIDKGGG